nr:tetratricopeptide repeat protein 5-like [Onthophagus taurus]
MSTKDDGNVNGDCTENKSGDILKDLSDRVGALYHFRDHYFETHDLKESVNKTHDVEVELNKIVPVFDEYKDCLDNTTRANYYYLLGKALNVVPKYDRKVEENLSKCLKLNPKLVNAWNELGECYWKNDNLKEATNCFNKALSLGKNKIALRNLSMLARQNSFNTQEERIKNIEKGLNYAKEAVQIDPHDGTSWAVLANAHLASFFGITQNPKTLKQCLSAYNQAEKDIVAKSMPDLHYNKAITLKYEEEFKLALESFNESSLYDPTWDPPKIKQKQLVKYLKDVNELTKTSGKMKLKKLQQLLQSINESKQLGPFSGGSYTSTVTGATVKLNEVKLNDLQPGLNEEKVILGKVVCSVHNEDTVPFTFCMVDNVGSCVVVTVYNIAEGKGVIIGDSVAIPEPYVTDVDFVFEEMVRLFFYKIVIYIGCYNFAAFKY